MVSSTWGCAHHRTCRHILQERCIHIAGTLPKLVVIARTCITLAISYVISEDEILFFIESQPKCLVYRRVFTCYMLDIIRMLLPIHVSQDYNVAQVTTILKANEAAE